VVAVEASVVAVADDVSDETSVLDSAAVVAGASVGAVVASPPSSSSSPQAAAINERPTAIAAIRLVRLLITWILLIEFQREVILPLAALESCGSRCERILLLCGGKPETSSPIMTGNASR
jgi:hypothetical protein